MKNEKRLLLIGFLIVAASCNLDKLLTFSFTDKVTFTIPSTLGVNTPFSVPTPPVESEASESFSNNDTRIGLVKNITLKSIELKIDNPSNQTFSFLNKIQIFISTEGEEELLIAEETNIPDNIGNLLNLISTGSNLDAYIKSNKYQIRTEVTTDESFLKDIEILATMTFKVTADPF
ncbi:MAG: hypothetical protein ACJATA_000669 [Sphingobacteriales bacterium]|jgi:hypothetical protein